MSALLVCCILGSNLTLEKRHTFLIDSVFPAQEPEWTRFNINQIMTFLLKPYSGSSFLWEWNKALAIANQILYDPPQYLLGFIVYYSCPHLFQSNHTVSLLYLYLPRRYRDFVQGFLSPWTSCFPPDTLLTHFLLSSSLRLYLSLTVRLALMVSFRFQNLPSHSIPDVCFHALLFVI